MTKGDIKRITNVLKPFSHLASNLRNEKSKRRIILMYHGISKRPQFNCITRDLFRDQVAWLKERYSMVSLSEFMKALAYPEMSPSHLVAITFDDGYVNFAELALPILKKYGCHATVFVPAGKVGHFNDWDMSARGFQKMPIMSAEQLRRLPEGLAEIGSHGISHVPLDRASSEEVRREVVDSRIELEQKVGREIRFFAFPFGRYPFGRCLSPNQYWRKLLAPYRAACSTEWGRFNSQEDLYSLRRVGIWDSDSFSDFLDKEQGCYDWLVAKERVGRFYKFIKSLHEVQSP